MIGERETQQINETPTSFNTSKVIKNNHLNINNVSENRSTTSFEYSMEEHNDKSIQKNKSIIKDTPARSRSSNIGKSRFGEETKVKERQIGENFLQMSVTSSPQKQINFTFCNESEDDSVDNSTRVVKQLTSHHSSVNHNSSFASKSQSDDKDIKSLNPVINENIQKQLLFSKLGDKKNLNQNQDINEVHDDSNQKSIQNNLNGRDDIKSNSKFNDFIEKETDNKQLTEESNKIIYGIQKLSPDIKNVNKEEYCQTKDSRESLSNRCIDTKDIKEVPDTDSAVSVKNLMTEISRLMLEVILTESKT